jgi:hypothetical protein
MLKREMGSWKKTTRVRRAYRGGVDATGSDPA